MTRRSAAPTILSLLALTWALALLPLATLVPVYRFDQHDSSGATGATSGTETLVEHHGAGAVVFLLAPVLFAAASTWVLRSEHASQARPAIMLGGVVLAVATLLSAFGIFIAPVFILCALAAAACSLPATPTSASS